ncbi:MAG: FAD-dependent oxidoreductase [Patescibacteria group bacterium]
MTTQHFHTIVIGAGSAGLTAAISLAGMGKSVALVAEELGGDCTNSGCIPSKALLHAAKAGLSPTKALKHVRDTITDIRQEETELINKPNLQYFSATARFIDAHSVELENASKLQHLSAQYIVIATGSLPRILEIPGLPAKKLHTNLTIFEQKTLPKSMAVLGAGPISVELAQAFSQLGTTVHILHRGEGVLSKDDPEASEILKQQLEKDGVTFHWQTTDITWRNDKLCYQVPSQSGKQEKQLAKTEIVLQALGRIPNLAKLKLSNANISHTERGITVNRYYQTSQKHIFAIGDIIPDPKFTHLANAQGRAVAKTIGIPVLKFSQITAIPRVTYADPEIASEGLELAELEQLDERQFKKITVELPSIDRAKTDEITTGKLIIYAERLTGKILRVTLIAPQAGEILAAFSIAIQHKISLWKLSSTVFAYPTLALSIKKAADIFVIETLKKLKQEVLLWLQVQYSQYSRLVWAMLLWGVLIASFQIALHWQQLSLLEALAKLEVLLQSSWFGVTLFLLLYLLRPLFLFPAAILSALAGYLWGLPLGFAYAWIAGSVSALLPYATGRWIVKTKTPIDDQQLTTKHRNLLQRFADRMKQESFITILIMRLLYLPYDAVSLLAGYMKISLVAFFAATLLGNIFGTLTFVSLGSSIEGSFTQLESLSLNTNTILFSIMLFAVGLLISKAVKKFQSTE